MMILRKLFLAALICSVHTATAKSVETNDAETRTLRLNVEGQAAFIARVLLKAATKVAANEVKRTPTVALPNVSAEKTGDVFDVITTAAIEEEIPDIYVAGKTGEIVDALVPVAADHLSKKNAAGQYYGQTLSSKNGQELGMRLLQKASSKEFFMSDCSKWDHRILKIIDFGLTCVDAQELGEEPAGNNKIRLSKGITALVTDLITANFVQKCFSDMGIKSETRAAALADLVRIFIEPLFEHVVERVVTI